MLQKKWFIHQIHLASQQQLPLILHIRDAIEDALKILMMHRDLLHGGVAHCFHGNFETAMAFIELGFSLGIGGKLLSDDDEGAMLRETIKQIPLTSILVETDTPCIRPKQRILQPAESRRKKQGIHRCLVLESLK